MKTIIAFLAVVALTATAFGANSPNLIVQETDNGNGSYTYWVDVISSNEVTFMELWIHGNIQQNPGSDLYSNVTMRPWAPAVVFQSDQELAIALDPQGYDPVTDSIIIDKHNGVQMWPGKLTVSLNPPNDGSSSIHVELASYSGGEGGPLPGGPIGLAHITTWGRNLLIEGRLVTEMNPNNEIYFQAVPEPTLLVMVVSAFAAVMGFRGLAALGICK